MEAHNYDWQTVPREQVNDLFVRQLVTGEGIMLARLELKAGCTVPVHSHHNEQVSTVLSGRIKFFLGERELILGPGETLVIPRNVPHGAEVLEDFVGFDIFNPPREDWLSGSDAYLRK